MLTIMCPLHVLVTVVLFASRMAFSPLVLWQIGVLAARGHTAVASYCNLFNVHAQRHYIERRERGVLNELAALSVS